MDRWIRNCRALALALAGAFLLGSSISHAAPKDAAATKLADGAINGDYLATNFAEAEKKLRNALTTCGPSGCSPQVRGRIYRDLGVVLIAGLNRVDDGKNAFAEAIKADPDVALEKDLTTPEIDQAFKLVKSGGYTPTKPAGPAPVAAGDLIHTPPTEQLAMTALPLYAELAEGVTVIKVIARYKPFGTPDWKTIELRRIGNGYGGEIPCRDVGSTTGDLPYYIQATDPAGDVVSTSGSRNAPNKVAIKNELAGEAPHLPGRPPPSKCRDTADCPPGLPGCPSSKLSSGKGWGASCDVEKDNDCGPGLWCKNGTCDNGTKTENTEPVASGKYCDTSHDCEQGEMCSPAHVCERGFEKPKKIWLSLSIEQNFSFVGSQPDVCGTTQTFAAKQYTCIDRDNYAYKGFPEPGGPGTGNAIKGGPHLATTRFLVGFEHLIGENVTLGVRLGYAIGAAPGRTMAQFHGEGRVAFWFGKSPFSRDRVRPYLVVAGGLAEVDDKFDVPIIESNPDPSIGLYPTQTLRVWRQSGGTFAGGGGGVMIPTGSGMGILAEVKLQAFFPDAGLSLSPSVGYAMGL